LLVALSADAWGGDSMRYRCAALLTAVLMAGAPARAAEPAAPRFSRHVQAVFSRLGCNGGACHGAVKGQNGFRLSLFAADRALDHERLLRESGGRRLNLLDPDGSLLLLKATGRASHQGGRVLEPAGPEYALLRRWIAAGAPLDSLDESRTVSLKAAPAEQVVKPGERYRLTVTATFADGSSEDVTALCSFESLDRQAARVSRDGVVEAVGPGDAAILARYRAEPAVALAVVPRPGGGPFPDVKPGNFLDAHVLDKLRRLNLPPAALADDATFLRRASLDVSGELPTPAEVRAFLADKDPDKRTKKIDELLARPSHADLWTLKFCDLLKAADFGVYADGMTQEQDAPRFAAWVRARLKENTPYDEFAVRILTATSREGRSMEEWAREQVALADGYTSPRADLELYARRKTLDLYWLRKDSAGVKGTLQIAHAFLGLRLECAQCHRHPHDVWRQDDLLSFANFFMRVRQPGFQGDNEKKFAAAAVEFRKLNDEAKKLADEAKKQRDAKGKELDAAAKKAKPDADRLLAEARRLDADAERLAGQGKEDMAKAAREAAAARRKEAEPFQAALTALETFQREVGEMERKSKSLPETARRILHAEAHHMPDSTAFASVTSPLGSQTSKTFRLLGDKNNLTIATDRDPREVMAEWLRRPDNPYFAKAIVNRVWAHYFGRGLIDPTDNLSPFNPPSHPKLLDELAQKFIAHKYDLRWLHRTILTSRTYQQSSTPDPASAADRTNYAFFAYRRLGAEVLLDALNQATGTAEDMDMKFYHWPAKMKAIEVPYPPRNAFVSFMLEQFGRPQRNSAVQCDCERDGGASVQQVLSLANHPRVWQKIADDKGTAARVLKEIDDAAGRVEELFLVTLSRPPTAAERAACLKYLKEAPSPSKGVQGILWSLLNTREFLLQH
jgi:hypothetical protein